MLWGERFRNYFLEYCLPSMLSTGNIPALSTRTPSKYLIATRPEDWEAMQQTAIFKLLRQYIEPVYLEIPPCPPGKGGCEHMGTGHKIACEYAHKERAYAVLFTPDCMLSDGTVARLQQLAHAGTELVLTAALRYGEEPFLGILERMGLIPLESRRDSGTPITISGRQMVYAAINGFHSEALRYEWNKPYFHPMPSATWWRVPDEEGVLVHCLSWAPLLLDYGAIEDHDSSTLDNWTIDGDYVYKNLGKSQSIYVVQDSDEMLHASWAPLSDRPQDMHPNPLYEPRWFGNLAKGARFRSAFNSGVFDPLKQQIFFFPVRWHSRPLNGAWRPVEHRAMRQLLAFVRAPEDATDISAKIRPQLQQGIMAGAKFRPGAAVATRGLAALATMIAPAIAPANRALAKTMMRAPTLTAAVAPAVEKLLHRCITIVSDIQRFLIRAFHLTAALMRYSLLAVIIVGAFLGRVLNILFDVWRQRQVVFKRMRQVAQGDREARRRVLWRIRYLILQAIGKPLPIAEPPPPDRFT